MMKNNDKTRDQLLKELEKSSKKIAELEKSEVERKQAEKALKENEERYEGIIQSTASCIAVYKPVENGKNFVFVDFNAMAEKVEKTPKDKVIGKKVTEVFPGVGKFGLFAVFQKVWKTGKPEHFPVTVYKDDRIQGYRENYIYKLSSGEIVAVYQDITERKQTEENLWKNQQRLKEAQDIALLGRWDLNLINNQLQWSDSIFEIFEIDSSKFEASYEAFLEAIHPDDREKVNLAYTESLKTKLPYEISHRLLMKDGRIKWVLEKCRTEYDLQGKALQSIGIVQDITERKQAEEELQKNEAHYRQLFNSLPYGGEIIDIEGKIIDCSLSTSRMLGYEMNELIGKHITNFVDAKSVAIFKQNFPKLLKGESLSLEGCLVHKNGSRIDILRAAQPVYNSDREVVGMLALNIDITKRKQVEKELQKHREHLEELVKKRTEELEEKNKELKRYNKLFEGRELRIKELRDKVKELEGKKLSS